MVESGAGKLMGHCSGRVSADKIYQSEGITDHFTCSQLSDSSLFTCQCKLGLSGMVGRIKESSGSSLLLGECICLLFAEFNWLFLNPIP